MAKWGCVWRWDIRDIIGHFLLFLILPLYFNVKTMYLALFGVIIFSTTSRVTVQLFFSFWHTVVTQLSQKNITVKTTNMFNNNFYYLLCKINVKCAKLYVTIYILMQAMPQAQVSLSSSLPAPHSAVSSLFWLAKQKRLHYTTHHRHHIIH